jgi:hypothetical protein
MGNRFQPDDRVLYMPSHVNGDIAHHDCERGIVTSIGPDYIHVRFDGELHAKACLPHRLVKLQPLWGLLMEQEDSHA